MGKHEGNGRYTCENQDAFEDAGAFTVPQSARQLHRFAPAVAYRLLAAVLKYAQAQAETLFDIGAQSRGEGRRKLSFEFGGGGEDLFTRPNFRERQKRVEVTVFFIALAVFQ